MAAVQFDTLRSVAFGGISSSYAALGSPLTHNWRIVKIVNTTDGDLIISTDNTVSAGMDLIPAGSFTLYDLASNNSPLTPADVFVMAKSTQFYVKQSTAPTSGSVYLTGVYAKGQ